MIAVDTNLLVYAHREGCAEHHAARSAIESAAQTKGGWGIALPSFAEFWMVVTHPSSEGGASTVEQAGSYILALLATGRPQVLSATPSLGQRLTRTAMDLAISGPRVFDLQIALIAEENGADVIWTHDSGFVTVPGLKVEDPIAL